MPAAEQEASLQACSRQLGDFETVFAKARSAALPGRALRAHLSSCAVAGNMSQLSCNFACMAVPGADHQHAKECTANAWSCQQMPGWPCQSLRENLV